MKSAALARKFEAHDDGVFGLDANIVPLVSKRLIGRNYVEESDRLIRALASLSRNSDNMRVSHLRQRLKDLNRVERESVRLLSALETGWE